MEVFLNTAFVQVRFTGSISLVTRHGLNRPQSMHLVQLHWEFGNQTLELKLIRGSAFS